LAPQIAKQALPEPARFAACALPPPILAAVNGAVGRLPQRLQPKKKAGQKQYNYSLLFGIVLFLRDIPIRCE
jgi:hypothetical protein